MKNYVQKEAFEPHYSKTLLLKIPVGIDSKLKSNRQIILLDGDYKIDDELSLFTVSKTNKFYSPANKSLYDEKGKDTFRHEQRWFFHWKTGSGSAICGTADRQ